MVGIAYILEEEAGELQSQIKEMSKKKLMQMYSGKVP